MCMELEIRLNDDVSGIMMLCYDTDTSLVKHLLLQYSIKEITFGQPIKRTGAIV